MRKTTFKPQVTTLLSIAAGQQLEAIIVDGKTYIEYPTPEGAIGSAPDAGMLKEAVAPKETKAETAKPTGTKKVAEAKQPDYTEKELMEMSVGELKEIIEEMGIEIPKEGKDTNKKLRLLILDEQENAEEEEEAPTKSAGKKGTSKKEVEEEAEDEEEDDIEADLTDLFTRFDEGEIEEDEVVKELIELGYDKKDAKEIVEDFLNDDDITVAEYVQHLVDEDAEEEEEVEEEEEEEAPKRGAKKDTAKKSTAKEPKYEVVEIADLTKGDKVSVYFKSEKEFIDGEVKSILRGKVTVLFDDDSTEVLNAKENTEIRLLK